MYLSRKQYKSTSKTSFSCVPVWAFEKWEKILTKAEDPSTGNINASKMYMCWKNIGNSYI